MNRTVTLGRDGEKIRKRRLPAKKTFKVHFSGYTLSGIGVEHAHLKLVLTERDRSEEFAAAVSFPENLCRKDRYSSSNVAHPGIPCTGLDRKSQRWYQLNKEVVSHAFKKNFK